MKLLDESKPPEKRDLRHKPFTWRASWRAMLTLVLLLLALQLIIAGMIGFQSTKVMDETQRIEHMESQGETKP